MLNEVRNPFTEGQGHMAIEVDARVVCRKDNNKKLTNRDEDTYGYRPGYKLQLRRLG